MNRLLLLAWPGATAMAVSRLLDAGRLPNLVKLVERGAIGDLRPDCPGPEAMTWTTVATGHRADAHGVLGDIRARQEGSGVQWARSSDWQRRALWHFIDAAGGTAAVVNWPATHPAENLQRGVVVSPAFFHAPIGDPSAWLVPPGAIWSPVLRATLHPFRLHPSELTRAEAAALVPDAGAVDQNTDPRLAKVLVSLAANAGAHAVATHLAETLPQLDLLAVHFELLLAANEAADRSPAGMSYARTPDETLAFYDQMLGRYLDLLGKTVSVLIVSPGWRGAAGVLVAAGADVRTDVRIPACSTLDVLPIALRMMGFATPADAPSRAPREMFHPGETKLVNPPTPLPRRDDEPPGPTAHLLEAGYTPTAPPLLAKWAARQRATDLAQLGRLRLSVGDPARAASFAEDAERIHAAPRFIELAARAAFIAGDFPRAAAAADRLLAADPQSPAGHILKAFLAHRQGSPTQPSQLPGAGPDQRFYAGILAMMRGDVSTAKTLLTEAADAMPHDAAVHHALGLAFRQAGDIAAAIPVLARAANLSPQPAAALMHLAQALISAGQYAQAENALRQAMHADPTSAAPRALLSAVIRRREVTEIA